MDTTTDTTPAPALRRLAAAAALAVALAAVAARVALVYPVTSDDTTGVLEAQSVLRGNPLLRGWILSNISFYATDLPFYVAGVALRGPRPSLMRDVPVALYAAAVAAAALLARGRTRGALGAAAVVVLLGMPAGGLAEFVTKGYIRVGTMLGLFAALLALDPPAGRRVSATRVVLFAAILSLTILSDTYAAVVGAAPVLAVCVWGAIRGTTYDDVRVGRVALAVVGSVAAAAGLSWLIGAAGGYRVTKLPLRYWFPYPDPVGVVHRNAVALATSLRVLYRCDLVHGRGPGSAVIVAACLIGPGLVLTSLVMGSPFRPRRRPADFVGDVLWVSMLTGLLAFLVSAMPKDRDETRYLLPFVLSGAVLTGRVLAGRLRDVRPAVGALFVLGLAYAVTVVDDLRKPPADDTAIALAAWLDVHGLRHGYGPYWDASIVTVSGEGRVTVRAVRGRHVTPTRFVVEPFRWMTDARWYDEGPVNFVVYKTDPGKKFHFLMNESNCVNWFGPPSARHAAGPYTVLVWDHDLRPLLTRGLPWAP